MGISKLWVRRPKTKGTSLHTGQPQRILLSGRWLFLCLVIIHSFGRCLELLGLHLDRTKPTATIFTRASPTIRRNRDASFRTAPESGYRRCTLLSTSGASFFSPYNRSQDFLWFRQAFCAIIMS